MAKKRTIFTVTCYEPRDLTKFGPQGNSKKRTWGWFPTRHAAAESVMSSDVGVFEIGYYTYAVIEEYRSGILTTGDNPVWYKYDHKTKKVKEVPTPKFAKNIINYAMG